MCILNKSAIFTSAIFTEKYLCCSLFNKVASHDKFFKTFNPEADLGLLPTSKMERFVIIVNAWKPLTTVTKLSILDVAAALDLPL